MFEDLGKVILASSSQRRRELITKFNFNDLEIIEPSINEKKFIVQNSLSQSVKNIALNKALNVKKKIKHHLKPATIIAGDTIVYRAGKILHKPRSKSSVRECLDYLSSRKHRVLGGICVISKKGKIYNRVVTTEVFFEKIDKVDYCDELLNEGIGKSGGYAIQGLSSRFVKKIKGSYTNVVGLSIPEVYKILKIL